MPRSRRSKRTYYYRRYKKKWTPYNTEVTVTPQVQLPNTGYLENAAMCLFGASNSLGQYAAASDALSAVNYYVCRCRFKGVIQQPAAAGMYFVVYICYIPNAVSVDNGANAQQVVNLSTSYFYLHPEYVIAWTRIDYINGTGDTGEISLYSKIKKRLSPGDRIAICVLARNESGNQQPVPTVNGTFSCYLRTN